jgi:SpoVK/Ycf46/Vps4 family AAA+-type ATPase
MADKKTDIESDFVHLARIALSGRAQDVQVLLHRVSRHYRAAHPQLADAVTALLRESPTRSSPLRRQAETPLPVDADSRLHLMRVEAQPLLDHEPVLTQLVAQALNQLVQERRNLDALLRAGLQPTRTALLIGPPGVGKTMAARWLARELGRPLLILDLAAVMSSYLGRTGTNLRHVLEYAKTIDCVLLLDEVDAIAKRRDDRAEIGELKRLVTVLIQQIDDWPSTGLLMAATNHPDLLDPAIWRRFELTIDFPLPDRAAIARFVEALLSPHISKATAWASLLSVALLGRSFNDIERDVAGARRAAAISGIPLDERLASLIRSDDLPKASRIALAATLVNEGIVSQRKAHELTRVARDTIRDRTRKPRTKKRAGREVA